VAGGIDVLEKLTSPVFFSTAADGNIVRGLQGLPAARPLLLVGAKPGTRNPKP
jgi:hypothetical protein